MEPVETKSCGCCCDRGTLTLVMGLLIMAIGVLLLLHNLKVTVAQDVLRFWPLLLISIGVHRLWTARRNRVPGR